MLTWVHHAICPCGMWEKVRDQSLFGGLLLLDPVICVPQLYESYNAEMYASVVRAVTQRVSKFHR